MLSVIRTHPRTVALAIMLSLLVAVVASTASPARAAHAQGRVVNGTQVSPANFTSRWSYVVSLVDAADKSVPDGQFCAGSLIAPQLVLTAAHCVTFDDDWYYENDERMGNRLDFRSHPKLAKHHRFSLKIVQPKELDIVAGRRTLSDDASGQRIHVTGVIVNPKYDPYYNRYDVALLRLASPPAGVTPTPIVNPAETALWGNGAGLPVDAMTQSPAIAGWGERLTEDPDSYFDYGTAADTLTDVALPIRSDDECDHGGPGAGPGYGRYFDAKTQICVGTLDTHDRNDLNALPNGTSACYGDSGGPLMVSDGAGGWRVAGITSWGYECGSRSFFSVYTRGAAIQAFATSNPPLPVRNVKVPKITGHVAVSKTLGCTRGTWTGEGTISYKFQWYSVKRSSADQQTIELLASIIGLKGKGLIAGATSSHLKVAKAQQGSLIFCSVTATNASWTETASSDFTRPVAAKGR